MNSSYAPIVLFTYNRPEHVKRVICALLNNKEAQYTDIIIYSDAAKNDNAVEKVNQTRSYIKTVTGFNSVKIVERSSNLGLAANIIDGVTQVVNEYGRVIVLEDDHVTSPYFLQYMNEGLEKYEDNEKVASIHGYVYPSKSELPYLFFIKGADCWGWATWKRAWDKFNPDGKYLLEQLKKQKLIKQFDFDFSYPFTRMLENQIQGKNQSWAIRWCASAYINDMYTLYPGKSMVSLIGNDGLGTHGSTSDAYEAILHEGAIDFNKAPNNVGMSRAGYVGFKRFFVQQNTLRQTIYRILSALFGRRVFPHFIG